MKTESRRSSLKVFLLEHESAKSSKKRKELLPILTHKERNLHCTVLEDHECESMNETPADPDNCIIRKDKEIKQRETNLLIAR